MQAARFYKEQLFIPTEGALQLAAERLTVSRLEKATQAFHFTHSGMEISPKYVILSLNHIFVLI